MNTSLANRGEPDETNQWRESEWCLSPNEDLKRIEELIASSQWSHLSVIKTGFAIHLMEPQLSKGSGLKIILNKMNLSVDDLLCVGDAPNDLSMFEIAFFLYLFKLFGELCAKSMIFGPPLPP